MVEKKKKKVKRKTKPRVGQVITQKVTVNIGKGYGTKRRTGTQAKRSVPHQVVYQQQAIPLQPNYSSQINDLRDEVKRLAPNPIIEPQPRVPEKVKEIAKQEGVQGTDVKTEQEVARVMEDMISKVELRREQDFNTDSLGPAPRAARKPAPVQDFKPVVALEPEPKPAPKVVQERKHSQRHAELMRAHQEAVKAHEDTMRREIEFRERASRASQDRIAQSQIRASSDYMIALASQERDSTDLLERQKSFVEDVEKKQQAKKKDIQDEAEVARTVEGLIEGVEKRERKDKPTITFDDVFKKMAILNKNVEDFGTQATQRLDAQTQRTADIASGKLKKDGTPRKQRSDAGISRGELLRTADRRAQAAGFAVVSVPRETQQLAPTRAPQFEVQGNLRTFKPTLTPTLEDRTAFLGKAQAAFTGEGQTTTGKKKIKVGRLKSKAAQLKFEDAVRRSRESADEPFVGLGAAAEEEVTASAPTFI